MLWGECYNCDHVQLPGHLGQRDGPHHLQPGQPRSRPRPRPAVGHSALRQAVAQSVLSIRQNCDRSLILFNFEYLFALQ